MPPALRAILLATVMTAAGAAGWLGTACVAHLWQDHLLVDAARASAEAQQRPQAAPPPSPTPPVAPPAK